MAYAAEWDLDDDVLDREEVEAVVQHVAAMAHAAVEVAPTASGLHCTFRFPVSAAAHVVTTLDPEGKLLGEEWYRDLDPPEHGEDSYTVRLELHGPVDGGRIDDLDLDTGAGASRGRGRGAAATPRQEDDDDDEDAADVASADAAGLWDRGDEADEPDDPDADDDPEVDDVVGAFDALDGIDGCVARLRIDSHDNRDAWPVAFAIAAAVVDRLGGDLRDEFDENLYQQQLHLPRVIGPAVVGAGAGAGASAAPASAPVGRAVTSFGGKPDGDHDDDDDEPDDDTLN